MIIGKSNAILDAIKLAETYANINGSVLIVGEEGTGKELLAKYIYEKSHRNGEPFVAVHMGAIPKDLFELELFGSRKGAFSGAEDRTGRFEEVRNGTLLLDEIATMPLQSQPKILRALQERTYRKLGDGRELEFRARVISATNVNIEEAIQRHEFRRDLYDRLSNLLLIIPPLRDRKEDIPLLISYFLKNNNYKENFSVGLAERLQQYDYPGNVRQLQNIVLNIGAIYGQRDDEVTLDDAKSILASRFSMACSKLDSLPGCYRDLIYAKANEMLKRQMARHALTETGHSYEDAARLIGVNVSTLKSWQKY